jgi:hypothetical protein
MHGGVVHDLNALPNLVSKQEKILETKFINMFITCKHKTSM